MSPMLNRKAASSKPASTSFRTQSGVAKAGTAEVELTNCKTNEVWGFAVLHGFGGAAATTHNNCSGIVST